MSLKHTVAFVGAIFISLLGQMRFLTAAGASAPQAQAVEPKNEKDELINKISKAYKALAEANKKAAAHLEVSGMAENEKISGPSKVDSAVQTEAPAPAATFTP